MNHTEVIAGASTFGGADYFSVQIAVAILTCIAGVFTYTMGRYYWKHQSIQNLNDFLKTLDIDLVIEKLKFDNKFWKTAGVAMIASIVIVALVYGEIIGQIVPDEHILVTAFKFFAVGIGMNFAINSLAGGGKLSSIIQTILTAFLSSQSPDPQKLQKAKEALEAQHLEVKIIEKPEQGQQWKTGPETEETQSQ